MQNFDIKNIVLLLGCIICFLGSNKALSQEIEKKQLQYLSQLPPCSEKILTAEGITLKFRIHTIKYKKQWFVLSSDSTEVYMIMYDKKQGKPQEASNFMASGLIRSLQTGKYKQKEKPTKIDDLLVEMYFKPKGKAKKDIKTLLRLEFPDKQSQGILGKITGLFGLGK